MLFFGVSFYTLQKRKKEKKKKKKACSVSFSIEVPADHFNWLSHNYFDFASQVCQKGLYFGLIALWQSDSTDQQGKPQRNIAMLNTLDSTTYSHIIYI